MKNREYTTEELEYLKNNYLEQSNYDLGRELGRSENAISSKLKALKLSRNGSIEHYSDDEIKFIRDNVDKMTYTQIAKELGRSQSGITKYLAKHPELKLNELDLPRKPEKLELKPVDKYSYNWVSRGAKLKNYIMISRGGQIRFSSGLINRMGLKAGVKFDLLVNEKQNRFFIRFGEGQFSVQKHTRSRKIKKLPEQEYISASSGFKQILNTALKLKQEESAKMELISYNPVERAYELKHLPVKKRKNK